MTFNWRWNMVYAYLIPDIDALITLATEKKQFVHVGAAKIMKAYLLQDLVDNFGNVPYSDAFKGVETPSPTADTGQEVYAVAATLLSDAVTHLADPTSVGAPAIDIFYSGSKAQWTKLANTLKFRMALNTGVDADIQSALALGVIETDADNWVFQYGSNRSNPNSRHPWYSGAYEQGSWSYINNYYMWEFFEEKAVDDPRRRFYFKRQDLDAADEDQFTLDCVYSDRPSHYLQYTNAYGNLREWPFCLASSTSHINPSNARGYWGRDHGNNDGIPPDGRKRTAPGIYPAGGMYDEGNTSAMTGEGHTQYSGTLGGGGDGIQPILTASMVYFMRAEAALLHGTPDDAKVMLETGIQKSMDYVKSTSEAAGTVPSWIDSGIDGFARAVGNYKGEVTTAYDATTADGKLNIVVKEFRLALWGNGIEAWNAMRRTGKPVNNAGGSELQWAREADMGDFPRLWPYPSDYVNLNANATQQLMTTKVFWDTRSGTIY